jgi:hypothetical protein
MAKTKPVNIRGDDYRNGALERLDDAFICFAQISSPDRHMPPAVPSRECCGR